MIVRQQPAAHCAAHKINAAHCIQHYMYIYMYVLHTPRGRNKSCLLKAVSSACSNAVFKCTMS